MSGSAIRAFGCQIIEASSRRRFWSQYRASCEFDVLDEPDRRAVQRQRLAVVLEAARETGLHRRRLQQAGLPNERVLPKGSLELLERLPPISKDELRRNFPADALAPGSAADRIYLTTSGTTAERLTILADFGKRDARTSAKLRHLKIAVDQEFPRRVEIPANACSALCGVSEPLRETLPDYVWHAFQRWKGLGAHWWEGLRQLRPLQPGPPKMMRAALDDLLAEISRHRPLLLQGLPQYLLWLAERASFLQFRVPTLQVIGPYGGMASPQMAHRIAAGWGAEFRNNYGTAELGGLAASCSCNAAMHVFEDQFIVDVFQHDKPAPAGGVGQIVVTDLTNCAMPLIRYRVGDVGRLVTEACRCGRNTVKLEVLGRVQEVLESPRGALTPSEISDAVLADPGVSNFRIEEPAAGRFDISLVPSLDGPVPRPDDVRDRFAALHGGVHSVKCRMAAYLQPEPSGKYRLVYPAAHSRKPF
jgi:phenylacetate-CoA ligase